MIDHTTPTRALAAFLSNSDSKNPVVRGRVAGYLHFLVVHKGDDLRVRVCVWGVCVHKGEELRVGAAA